MSYHLYVSNSGSEWLSHFLMDEHSGHLEPQANIELEATPGALATNAAETLMFVALRSAKKLGSYAIDRGSGRLSQISGALLEEGPPYLRTDNTDRFLLASYYGAAHVSVHGIGADGSLSEKPLQWIETEIRAHSIQTDRSNRFAFVPHTNPTNAIYQFRFDETTGTLTPNDPPKIQPETEEGPRHFTFHPDRDILYSVNENGCTVSAHHFDPERGTLSSFQVISTLPADFDPDSVEGDITTAEIKMSADGKYLYASNRGPESLALFSVNNDSTLSPKAHYSTEPTPRFFDLDPSGNFLYSAGQNSGRLVSYRIDTASGALEPLETHEVGGSPLWITFVKQV